MRQSPSGCCDDFVVCGAAQTKPKPPRVAITMRTVRIEARNGRWMEPPWRGKKPAQELERRSWIFLQRRELGPEMNYEEQESYERCQRDLRFPDLNCRRVGHPD